MGNGNTGMGMGGNGNLEPIPAHLWCTMPRQQTPASIFTFSPFANPSCLKLNITIDNSVVKM